MKPAALIAYDQHDAIIADLVRLARAASMLPLELVNETLAKMLLTGRYVRPDGTRVLVPSEVVELHGQIIDTARAFVAAAREFADHAAARAAPAA